MPGEGNLYLQCTTMGPASGGLQVFTRLRKARNGVGYSGTPWSGHAVNWNCRTSRFSLEPFCRTRERQRQGGTSTPKLPVLCVQPGPQPISRENRSRSQLTL